MVSLFKRHWFLGLLTVSFGVGYGQAAQFHGMLHFTFIRDLIVFCVMLVMGITLPADQIRNGLRRPKPSLLAIFVNTLIVPLLVFPCQWFLPHDLFGGLFITAIVPSTLASASVWTRRAGGDDAVSMMTTVVTNLGCVLVVPLGIWLALDLQVQVDPWMQVNKLAILVALPLMMSQLFRWLGAGYWADRNKSRFSLAAQFGILSIVFWGAVSTGFTSGLQPSQIQSEFTLVSKLILCVVVVHISSLIFGVRLARRFALNDGQQIAVGFSGSQKTLMVGLQIAIDCGVSILPMILYHFGQLLIDTLVADRWRARNALGETSHAPPIRG